MTVSTSNVASVLHMAETRRDEIPSLTGLRGVAAWLVVIAHTSSFFVAMQPRWLDYTWGFGSNLAMTTFFVLSGFVIHYNYGAAITAKGGPAIRSFLVARFARLYPLYVLTLLIAIALSPSIVREDAFWQWSWRYLTMSQDWTPTLLDGKPLWALYIGAAWSISAEVGIYLFYLLVAMPLDWLRNVRSTLTSIGILAIACTIIVAGYACGFWFGSLPLAGWWFYLSPVARAPEFLLGALIAQIYLVDPNLPNTRWLGIAGASWVIAAFAASYVDPGFQPSFAFAPGVAAVMFFLARHRDGAASSLATPIMRVLGDASYSIYMLHGIVLSYVIRQSPYLPTGLRIAMAWALIILLSIAVYHYFEAPARRWIRMIARASKPGNKQHGKVP